MNCIVFRPPHISSCHRLWTCLGKQANVPLRYRGTCLVWLYYARLFAGLMSLPAPSRLCGAWPARTCEEEEDSLAIDDPGRRSGYGATPLVRVPLLRAATAGWVSIFVLPMSPQVAVWGSRRTPSSMGASRAYRRVKGCIPHLQRIKGTGANVGVAPYTLRRGHYIRGIGSCVRTGRVAAGARSRAEGHGEG